MPPAFKGSDATPRAAHYFSSIVLGSAAAAAVSVNTGRMPSSHKSFFCSGRFDS